jgi:hypothetical protein
MQACNKTLFWGGTYENVCLHFFFHRLVYIYIDISCIYSTVEFGRQVMCLSLALSELHGHQH